MLQIKKLFLLFFFSFLSLFFSSFSLFFSLFSYYRPEISKYDWRNGFYGSIYPMVTLDGNLSNPLDQKLHTLFGHHQYISPITTIIYISHSFTQPRTLHNQHNNILHTTIQLHTSTTHWLNHMVMQAHADLMQAHADPMQAFMQSHVPSTPIFVACGCASIS